MASEVTVKPGQILTVLSDPDGHYFILCSKYEGGEPSGKADFLLVGSSFD